MMIITLSVIFSFSFWLFIILKERTIHNSLNVEINESSTVWVALGLWQLVPGWRMNKLVWAEVIGTLTLVQLSSPKYRSWQFVKRLRELSQMRLKGQLLTKPNVPLCPDLVNILKKVHDASRHYTTCQTQTWVNWLYWTIWKREYTNTDELTQNRALSHNYNNNNNDFWCVFAFPFILHKHFLLLSFSLSPPH